jgi:PAS domain S-box-containing protein
MLKGQRRTVERVMRGALSALEQQLAAEQQLTHIGSWEWVVGGETVQWSDELFRIYGLEPQSRPITFDFFLSCLHADDRAAVQGQVARALQHGGRFHYPERVFRPDGSMRELDTVGEARRDEQGRVVRLIGTCRDVTEERQRERAIQLYGDVVRNVQIGLTVWRMPAPPVEVGAATLVTSNLAAEQATGVALADAAGRTLAELFPSAAAGALGKLIADVARDGAVRQLEAYRWGDAAAPGRSFAVKAFPVPGDSVGVALEDVSAALRARHIQEAEQSVLEMIAAGAPLPELLDRLVLHIEELAPPAIASILLLDAEGKHVLHGAAPGLPAQYNDAIHGAAIGPRAGSCGTAAYRGEQVIVTDIELDPLWADYRDLARSIGVRACWSRPIIASDGRVLGTFALYYREPREPTAADLELIARAGHVAGLAIQRRQLDDQLRALSVRIEAAREDERSGIAREIHDVLGQELTVVKLDLAWIARRAYGDGEAIRAKVTDLTAAVDRIIQTVRRISAELRPGELDDLGLVPALEWQAFEFEKRTGVPCRVVARLEGARPARPIATALFRIFQETLTNITRHAEASRVDVVLRRDGDHLQLEVRDDGKGISVEAARSPSAIGLLGIRERARALGGTAHIGPIAPRGTQVSVDVPGGGGP